MRYAPAMTTPLACPRCANPYRADDVSVAAGVAACRACDLVFPLAPDRAAKRATPRPARWREDRDGGALVLRRRWIGLHVVFLAVWCAVWDAVLVGMALSAPEMAPFMAIHGAVGVAMTWYTLGVLVNTTTIRVERGRLSLAYGPLWWPGGVELSARDVDQLFVEEARTNRRTTWRVVAVDAQGVGRKVSPVLATLEEGRWLEARLEEELGVVDRPMEGEAAG